MKKIALCHCACPPLAGESATRQSIACINWIASCFALAMTLTLAFSAYAAEEFPGSPVLQFNIIMGDYITPVVGTDMSKEGLVSVERYGAHVKSADEKAIKGGEDCNEIFLVFSDLVTTKYPKDWVTYTLFPTCAFKDPTKKGKLSEFFGKGEKIFTSAIKKGDDPVRVARGYLEFVSLRMGFMITAASLDAKVTSMDGINSIMGQGLSDTVLAEAKLLAKSEPENYKYSALVARVLTGRAFMKFMTGGWKPLTYADVKDAVANITSAIAMDKGGSFASPHYDRGLIEIVVGGDFDIANANFLEALKRAPWDHNTINAVVAIFAMKMNAAGGMQKDKDAGALAAKMEGMIGDKFQSPDDLALVAKLYWIARDNVKAAALVKKGLVKWPTSDVLAKAEFALK